MNRNIHVTNDMDMGMLHIESWIMCRGFGFNVEACVASSAIPLWSIAYLKAPNSSDVPFSRKT